MTPEHLRGIDGCGKQDPDYANRPSGLHLEALVWAPWCDDCANLILRACRVNEDRQDCMCGGDFEGDDGTNVNHGAEECVRKPQSFPMTTDPLQEPR